MKRGKVSCEALARCPRHRDPRVVTSALDEVVDELGSGFDPWMTEAARYALERSEW